MTKLEKYLEKRKNSYSKYFLGPTLGETLQAPTILAEEQRILGMNNAAGKLLRQYLRDRVDPNVLGSIPDLLVAEAANYLHNNEGELDFVKTSPRYQLAQTMYNIVKSIPDGSCITKTQFLYTELFGNKNKQMNFKEVLDNSQFQWIESLINDLEKLFPLS